MSEAVVEYQQGIVRGFSPPLTPTMTLEVFSFPPVGPWASGLGYALSLMVQVHVDADGLLAARPALASAPRLGV